MYWLSRWLLTVTSFGWIFSALYVGVVQLGPIGCLLGAFPLMLWLCRRRIQRLTTLGSARWADEDDLRRAGMIHADRGLILGRIHARWNMFGAIGLLWSHRIRAKQACEAFWASFCRGTSHIVRLPQAIHTVVFAPTGGGKGVSCVVPFLMSNDEPCVVIDYKGENARLTAEHRRRVFGHNIRIIDPFHIVTQRSDCLNPLDFINADSPTAIDDCLDLANALVIRTGEEKEPHWNDSAEAWIAGFLATVVRYGGRDDGTRSLQTLRDLLSNPQKLAMATQLMCESDAWGGMLSRMGGQLSHYVDKERSSTLTTVARHLRFLDTMAVAESTKASSFNPAELLSGKTTVYLVLPPEHMRAKSALLRLWIGTLLRAVVRGGLQERRKVHFILDEAASLGHMEAIDDAVDKYRGYGVRLLFIYQSIGQLRNCFPNGQEQTLLSNVSQVFFGVNENATAEYVSDRLGDATIKVESGSESSGRTKQFTHAMHPQETASWSSNSSTSWQQQARRLLKPDEVIALNPRLAITFTPGVPPVMTQLLRYYEEKGLGWQAGWFGRTFAATNMLFKAAVFCAASLMLAYLVTVLM